MKPQFGHNTDTSWTQHGHNTDTTRAQHGHNTGTSHAESTPLKTKCRAVGYTTLSGTGCSKKKEEKREGVKMMSKALHPSPGTARCRGGVPKPAPPSCRRTAPLRTQPPSAPAGPRPSPAPARRVGRAAAATTTGTRTGDANSRARAPGWVGPPWIGHGIELRAPVSTPYAQ